MPRKAKQPVRTAPSQEYGSRVRQERMQQVQPLPQRPPVPSAPPTPLWAASQRPQEPVTAGLAVGAGPGPEVLPGGSDPTVMRLRALYALHPDPDLRRLLARAEGTGDPDLSLNNIPGRRAWFAPRITEDDMDVPRIPDRALRPELSVGGQQFEPWAREMEVGPGIAGEGTRVRTTNKWHEDEGHVV